MWGRLRRAFHIRSADPYLLLFFVVGLAVWIGFPVGYAVSGILLTNLGYFAMLLA